MTDYYELLGVEKGAAPEEIEQKIKAELRLWQRRTNSADLSRRQEAERRVEQLTEARAALLGSARQLEDQPPTAQSLPAPSLPSPETPAPRPPVVPAASVPHRHPRPASGRTPPRPPASTARAPHPPTVRRPPAPPRPDTPTRKPARQRDANAVLALVLGIFIFLCILRLVSGI